MAEIFTRKILAFAFDPGVTDELKTRDNADPKCWRGAGTEIWVTLVRKSGNQTELYDLSNLTGIVFEVFATTGTTASDTLLITENAGAINNALSANEYERGTDCHFRFVLEGVQTGVSGIENNSGKHYFRLRAATTDAVGDPDILAFGYITFVATPTLTVGAPAPGTPGYVSTDELTARLGAYKPLIGLPGQLEVLTSPSGNYRWIRGVTDDGERIDLIEPTT